MKIAQNNGRYYRVELRQMRYFPIKKTVALAALADGTATEEAYAPFTRGDLQIALMEANKAIEKAQAGLS